MMAAHQPVITRAILRETADGTRLLGQWVVYQRGRTERPVREPGIPNAHGSCPLLRSRRFSSFGDNSGMKLMPVRTSIQSTLRIYGP